MGRRSGGSGQIDRGVGLGDSFRVAGFMVLRRRGSNPSARGPTIRPLVYCDVEPGTIAKSIIVPAFGPFGPEDGKMAGYANALTNHEG